MDQPGGRVMGDVTTVWLLNLLDIYRNTGDIDFLTEMWPVAAGAARWQIGQAAQSGLPQHLTVTYDIIDLQQYNESAFASMAHLAAMLATVDMAAAVGDAATGAAAQAAYNAGVAATFGLLWNSTYQYFRAYTGGDAVMADSLYGAVYGHHVGVGFVVNQTNIAAHLAAELKYNTNPYGLTVMTGRNTPPPEEAAAAAMVHGKPDEAVSPRVRAMRARAKQLGVDTTDDVNWMGAGPDWSYMAIVTGQEWTSALGPTFTEITNYRDRLHDLWNVAGLYSTGDWGTDNNTVNGQPYSESQPHSVELVLVLRRRCRAAVTPLYTCPRSPLTPCPPPRPVAASSTCLPHCSHFALRLPHGAVLPHLRAERAADQHSSGQAVLRARHGGAVQPACGAVRRYRHAGGYRQWLSRPDPRIRRAAAAGGRPQRQWRGVPGRCVPGRRPVRDLECTLLNACERDADGDPLPIIADGRGTGQRVRNSGMYPP
jgi:hypothetical protein